MNTWELVVVTCGDVPYGSEPPDGLELERPGETMVRPGALYASVEDPGEYDDDDFDDEFDDDFEEEWDDDFEEDDEFADIEDDEDFTGEEE